MEKLHNCVLLTVAGFRLDVHAEQSSLNELPHCFIALTLNSDGPSSDTHFLLPACVLVCNKIEKITL